ncbi:hypothetical protein GCM10023189_50960 [Nibrella saemangeumensis]|uniref:Histidine kinase domain-containing protein n=1 Tax=Nibrella saemangeumensis TaxID=1084526 RepID=A0ABP8NHI8_9BACT
MKQVVVFWWMLRIVLPWLALSVSQAQPTHPAFEHYTTDQGLSHDEVTCLLKDRQGFMWFGTVKGLNRFDGTHFKQYYAGPGQLPGNHVYDMAPDEHGQLWIATDQGLTRLDPVRETFTPIRLPKLTLASPTYDIFRVVPDGRGSAWFGSMERLFKIDIRTLQYKSYPLPDDIRSKSYIVKPTIDPVGRLWLVLGGAIYRFDEGTGQYHYYAGRNFGHLDTELLVSELLVDSRKQLLAATWGKGLWRYNAQTDTFAPYKDLGGTAMLAMAEDSVASEGRLLWIGGGLHGVQQYWLQTGRYIDIPFDPQEPYSHNGGTVSAVFKDQQSGIVWFATDKGVEKIDPWSVRFQRKRLGSFFEDNQFNIVSGVVEDNHTPGRYWLSVWVNGVYRWDQSSDKLVHYRHENTPALKSNELFDIVQDKTGRIYLGSRFGLVTFDPAKNKWQSYFSFLKTPKINHKLMKLLLTDDGRLWMGTNYEGLWYVNTTAAGPEEASFKQVPLPGGYPEQSQQVVDLAIDNRQRLWVASNRGLHCVDRGGQVARQIPLGRYSQYQMAAVLATRNGSVWVAGTDFLLELQPSGHIRRVVTPAKGLQGQVQSLLEDSQGAIWMATNNYLHRLDPATGLFSYYKKEDGLISNSLNTLRQNRNGDIFIGHINGFNRFDPLQLRVNRLPPPIAITSIEVMNQPRRWATGEPVTLQADENVVTIRFAALNFSQSSRNRYAYKLEGFDQDWVYSTAGQATYTNLDGGDYQLRVRACNNDGVWNEAGLTVPLTVKAPVYKTAWFRTGLILLGLLIVLGVSRYRQQQRRRIDQIRRRIASDLHDDMGSTLSSIRIISDVLQQQAQQAVPVSVPMLARISESATALSESMHDIIWAIKPDEETLEDLVTRMRHFANTLLDARGIAFDTAIPPSFTNTRLDLAQRRNLYLIFKEALNNAVKYAECTQVRLSLQVTGSTLTMSLEDNGRGFVPSEIRAGNGLLNLHRRAAEIGGILTVYSIVGQGTRVELSLKIT